MDPLSDVLALLKPAGYMFRGLDAAGEWAIRFAGHRGINCYAVLAGQVWLTVEGWGDVLLEPGDCVLLPMRQATRLGVSVLSHEQEEASRSLATRGADRFAGLPWRPTQDGAVLLAGVSAWLDCSVEREIPAGDHEIVLLRVHRLGTDPEVAPLVFHGSRSRRLA